VRGSFGADMATVKRLAPCGVKLAV
jgi:hypothetical protein